MHLCVCAHAPALHKRVYEKQNGESFILYQVFHLHIAKHGRILVRIILNMYE